MDFSISILICTRDRASALRKTLQAFQTLEAPRGSQMELIIVDNGSKDDTRAVVEGAKVSWAEIRYIFEPEPPKTRALNRAMAAASGELLLFTDDDVVPTAGWLQSLAAPLWNDRADAVVGRIDLAPELIRPWMSSQHKIWLAATDNSDREVELIGANMGLHRKVLQRVPEFDVELGPGALGFGDDTLFSFQLALAGYRLARITEAQVTHYPEASRLLRRQWLRASELRGRTQAYLRHHWYHTSIPNPRIRGLCFAAKLALRRQLQPPPALDQEGCPRWEISYVTNIAMCRQFLTERQRTRNYAERGLRRLVGEGQRGLFVHSSIPSLPNKPLAT